MSEQFSYHVFLSHSSKDKPEVRELAARLKRDGIRVWLDEEQIEPGDSIPAKIEAGLEHSRVLVLCMSVNAFGRSWRRARSGFCDVDPFDEAHNARRAGFHRIDLISYSPLDSLNL